MDPLRHARIGIQKAKDVLAGNRPQSPHEVYKALPWVSTGERFSYALFSLTLYPLYVCRNALPPPLRRMLLLYTRDLDPGQVKSAFKKAYTVPDAPQATGSSYELYVCRSKKDTYPDLAVRIHKNIEDAEELNSVAQAAHQWHQEQLGELVSWQAHALRSLGGKKKHHITVSEYSEIVGDICAGHSKSALRHIELLLATGGVRVQKQFVNLVEKMRSLMEQGVFLDIGGSNNIVFCKKGNDPKLFLRVVDTGLIGLHVDAPASIRDDLSRRGIYSSEVSDEGGEGTWSKDKYVGYLAMLERIADTYKDR